MKPSLTFSSQSDSRGYVILCNGTPLGGAGSMGTATHTSTGKARHWRHRIADAKMHRETAERVCWELEAGRGPAYLRKNIPTT